LTRSIAPRTRVERLVFDLFDGTDADPLAVEMAGWLEGSRRYRAFVEEHRDKIRKKLRGAADPDGRGDLRSELRTAQLLLADRRMDVAFEAYGSGVAGPDFTVTFRGGRPFNLEVTRLRGTATASSIGGQVLTKLRQLQPSVPNAVLIAIDTPPEAVDVESAILALRARADTDDAMLSRRGFGSAREFRQRLSRLGAVLVWSESGVGEARATPWVNREARISFPEPAARAILLCLGAG
jgi:hypothetical protein